jgi:hypothetical protein
MRGSVPLVKNLSRAALKMKITKKLEFYFPSGVEDNESIHILVQAPSCKSSGRSHPITEITAMQHRQRFKGVV